MKKQLTRILSAAFLSFIAWSCNQSDPAPKGDYIQGVFVINEGNFLQNNGALSFFSREQTTADADIYSTVNKTTLKGGVQGYAIAGDRGLILVDNSTTGDKLEIVNSNTFEKISTISAPDIENPREVLVISDSKAYVSCFGSNADYSYSTGYIAVVDLVANKVTKKIAIGNGPENLVLDKGKVYVGTVSYGGGKKLTVINSTSDEILKTVDFKSSASPIGIDANGKLWVGSGLEASRLNTDTYAVESTMKIGSDASKSAGNYTFSSDLKTIYFVLSYYDASYVSHGETYKFAITDASINVSTPFIKRIFTGLSVDPTQGLIYAAVTPSYTQSGYAVRYRSDGTLVDSIKVGIAPTGFFFR